MDIYRYFHLAWQDNVIKDGEVVKPGFPYLIQQSEIDGDYGKIVFRVVAQLSSSLELHSLFIETSGASDEVLFNIRNLELKYFLSNILPLFNPLSRIDYEIPFPSSPEPSNP